MALHLNLAEHEADPPIEWVVRKEGRRWQLINVFGAVVDTFNTKREAEAAKVSGRLVDLYDKEGRWFRGEQVEGWKPYRKKESRCPVCGHTPLTFEKKDVLCLTHHDTPEGVACKGSGQPV
jgi:hypothetical protein